MHAAVLTSGEERQPGPAPRAPLGPSRAENCDEIGTPKLPPRQRLSPLRPHQSLLDADDDVCTPSPNVTVRARRKRRRRKALGSAEKASDANPESPPTSPSASASSDRREERRGGSERGAAVGGDLTTGVDGSDRGDAGGAVADGGVGGDAGFASSNVFSADPRALRRRRFRRARTVTLGEGVQTSSSASRRDWYGRSGDWRCRGGVLATADGAAAAHGCFLASPI